MERKCDQADPHMSDVIDVIKATDPDARDIFDSSSSVELKKRTKPKFTKPPRLIITEQPLSAIRFRYKCEGRTASSIPGTSSTEGNRTYPAIKIENFVGKVMVIVSCVTHDKPYRVHPHSLVGANCKNDFCRAEVDAGTMTKTFTQLGIQCAKKMDVTEALQLRRKYNVDPFGGGFEHQPSSYNLHVVRLCFQAFLQNAETGLFDYPLQPVVSEPIQDKKSKNDLGIYKLSSVCCPANGDKQIILLCGKVNKDDISIRFYQLDGDNIVWNKSLTSSHFEVYKQYAIIFKPPEYANVDIDQAVDCYIQLVQNDESSEPLSFQYTPIAHTGHKRKRSRIDFDQFQNYNVSPQHGRSPQRLDVNQFQHNVTIKEERYSPNILNPGTSMQTMHQFSPSPEALYQMPDVQHLFDGHQTMNIPSLSPLQQQNLPHFDTFPPYVLPTPQQDLQPSTDQTMGNVLYNPFPVEHIDNNQIDSYDINDILENDSQIIDQEIDSDLIRFVGSIEENVSGSLSKLQL